MRIIYFIKICFFYTIFIITFFKLTIIHNSIFFKNKMYIIMFDNKLNYTVLIFRFDDYFVY